MTDPQSINERPIHLSAAQARVLGALVEKEVTTPDYYPQSLNALINACNQLTNREPVMHLDDEEVRLALHRLEDLGLAGRARGADGRVAKYEHWLGEAFNFTRAETALICVLLLRGHQTPGELRGRTERMYHFEELDDVVSTLDRLAQREPPLARVLPRQPGTKESRYTHLFAGEPQIPELPISTASDFSTQSASSAADRLAQLEEEVAALRRELSDVQQQLAAFRKQFE